MKSCHRTVEFKEFDEMVKTYYPLNKEKTRYLIFFKDGYSIFYSYDPEKRIFTKESGQVF
jgi:hypothetical protein